MTKINKEIINKKNKVKKEHLIILILWISGITLTIFWLAFVIATSISSGKKLILSGEETIIKTTNVSTLKDYLQNANYIVSNIGVDETTGLLNTINFRRILKVLDWNPLCLTYDQNLTGWYMLILLAPVGYMSCIFIIAAIKNTITPGAIIKTNRKALQFGYLKQTDVDYIIKEVKYNAGIVERPSEDKIKIDIKKVIEYEERQ